MANQEEYVHSCFTIDTAEFEARLKAALADGYLNGRIEVIPGVLLFVVYPNRTPVVIRLKAEKRKEGG